MSNKMGYIYAIRCTGNDKYYIGQTCTDVNIRWRGHKSALLNNKHHSKYLQNSVNKYGIDSLEFSILQICSIEKLDVWEIYYIALFNTIADGFNTYPGGNTLKGIHNPMYGKHHSEEHRKKLSVCMSKENNPIWDKGKAVLQIDKITKEVIAKYPSAKTAIRALNLKSNHIGECCDGKRLSAGGYIWKWAE